MTTEPNEPPVDPTPLELEAYGWVVRFVSGKAGPEDITALKAWVALSPDRAAAFDVASKVWKEADPTRRPIVIAGTDVNANPVSARPQPEPRRIGRRVFLGGAVAASAAGTAILVARPPFGLWPSWSELAADYRTEPGEQRRITLADDVSIELNTRTSLVLRPANAGAGDIELVGGEAIIATPPASAAPITVLAGDGRVIAANARFNVRHDDSASVRVTCLRGRVQVEHHGSVLALPPDQQVIYSDQGLGTPVAIDPERVTAWKDGIVIFESTPISEVVAEVNRYRRGSVILTNAALGRERLNARFNIANIDRVIGQIEQVFGARARSLPGEIVLLG